ncbi:uncharacterized protein CBL_04097 [Carabus blaptoides fortunei]
MLPHLSDICDESWEDCDTEMGNDNCGCLGCWPRTKPPMHQNLHGWAYLPSVLLQDIFKLLNPADRLRASSVCRTWRQALYHPSFWQDMCFNITRYDLQRHNYFSVACGHLVRNAIVKYNSLSDVCVYEVASLLQRMTKNLNIRSLMFEPSHCHMFLPPRNKMFLERCMIGPLIQIASHLERLSLGCCEDLCQYVPQILQSELFNPQNIKVLGLASMKDDPGSYLILDCDPIIFEPFTNIQILSVDYDYVSDKFLESLNGASQLTRLIIHLHGFWEEHPGTTNEAWEQFVANHPQCQLRLTLIHAYEAVQNMHDQILHPSMPLTHLKVFFCEDLNLTVFNLISSWYARSFRSIMWVDSQSQETSWSLIKIMGENDANHPDPLVMAAWLCPKLEEIVLLGYKYFEEDLVGIARLCENKLRRLEVADEEVIYSHEVYRGLTDSKEEISKVLGRPWAPLQNTELHPVICNPTAGDSDEYLLPIVLADLY